MYRGDIASRVGLNTVLFGHTPAGIGGWTISGWRNGSAFVVIGGVWFIDVSGNSRWWFVLVASGCFTI
jgi:hypothetical protein